MILDKINQKIIYVIAFIISVICIIAGFPMISCFIYGAIAIYLAYQNNEKTIIGFLILAVFQNIILIVLAKYISPTYNTILSLIKEIMLYLALIKGALFYIKEKSIISIFQTYKTLIILMVLFGLTVLKNVLITSVEYMSILVSIRQMIIPLCGFFVGYFLFIDNNGREKIIKAIVIIGISLTLFGIVEMFLPENIIWNALDYELYLNNKESRTTYLYYGVTPNFYTWDFGFLMRRLVSITADPLATSHLIFLSLSLLVCFKNDILKSGNKKIYYIGAVILFLGCILGLSKGTMIYLAILILGLIYNKYQNKIGKKALISIVSAIMIIGITAITVLYFTADQPTAITRHMDGLIKGIKESSILGHGMGIAGATNHAFTGISTSNAESYVGVNLTQIGYIGTIILIILWTKLFIYNFRYYLTDRTLKNMFVPIIMLGLTIDMILSESSVSITGTGIYFILIGIFSSKIAKEKISLSKK